MQEVRVAQTGVQVLFGFVLTVPLAARFDALTGRQTVLYFATLGVSGAAAMLLIAPTSHHRVLFRCGDKDHLVRIANRYAIAVLACIGVAMVGALVFVGDVVFGSLLAGAVGALAAVACALSWYGQPLLRRHALVRASAAAVARPTSGRVGGRRLESSGSTVTRDPVSNRDALPCTACREGEPGYAAWSRPQ